MQKVTEQKLYRVIDANFNRAKEGLRVCEDVCRFILDDAKLTRKFKSARQKLTENIVHLKLRKVIGARAIQRDVGRSSTKIELKRKNVDDILMANMQRVKESIRVLEEFSKLLNKRYAQNLKKLRYSFYAIEQDVIKRR